jgi:hypothetical protein
MMVEQRIMTGPRFRSALGGPTREIGPLDLVWSPSNGPDQMDQ